MWEKTRKEICTKELWRFWLLDESSLHLSLIKLIEIGLYVCGIVIDNHSANVTAFSALIKIFNSGSNYYIKEPQNSGKTFVFYDTVHLMKNIKNSLLNKKKFVSRVCL